MGGAGGGTLDEHNPYEAPRSAVATGPRAGPAGRRGAVVLHLAWVAVFAANLIVPLLFGWGMAGPRGRSGLVAAAALILGLGSGLCYYRRDLAAPLVVGATLVALTQLFPLLQILAGVVGVGIVRSLGLMGGGGDGPPQILGPLGGFVVTLVTGGILIAVSAGAGLFLRFFTPARWWPRAS